MDNTIVPLLSHTNSLRIEVAYALEKSDNYYLSYPHTFVAEYKKNMQSIDMLIHAGWVIPVEPENKIYEHYAIAVHNGEIVDLLPSSEAVSRFAARITHRLTSHLLAPGFINTHTHAAMNLLRGVANDLPLHEWLNNHIWPLESTFVGPEFVADGTRLALAEMLRGGTTCFNDMYFFPDITGEIAEQVGMRAVLGLIVLDFPSAWAQNSEEYLQKAQQIHDNYTHHPLIRTAFAPHAPYTVSDVPLQKIQELAEKWDIPIHIHLHETLAEIDQSMEQYKLRPLGRLNDLGLLSSRLVGVHATQLENDEIQLLAEKAVNIVHCPESNLKLASGFCPVHKLSAAQINVALGTDSAASNDDLDILGEMKTAALLAKGLSRSPKTLPAWEVLKMATLNGAKALGIDKITGSLIPGKSADIVAIDMQNIELQPVYNPLSHLIYATGRDKITDVWVAGKQLMKSKALTTLDIHEVKVKTHTWRDKISHFKAAQSE